MIKRGDQVTHRDGTIGEATAGETGGTVQVKVKGMIQNWSIYDIVSPKPPKDSFADTTLDEDDE